MTFMMMPNKQPKEHRVDAAHALDAARKKQTAEIARAAEMAAARNADGEEKCPIIRANHIVFSSGRTGRTRVVFY